MKKEQVRKILIPFLESMKKDNYIIYGTGEVAEIYFEEIKLRFGEDAIHYFVNGTSVPNTKLANKPILHYSELKNIEIDKYKFILATVGSSTDDMKKRLLESGVKEQNILLPVSYFNHNELERQLKKKKEIHILPEFETFEECNSFIEIMQRYIDFTNTKIKFFFYIQKYNEMCINELQVVVINGAENVSKIPNDEIIIVRYAELLLTYKKKGMKSIFCIDEQFLYGVFLKMMIAISRVETLGEDEFKKQSKTNFLKLKKLAEETIGIGIIGNGPSIGEAVEKYNWLWAKTFNIVCNYIYRVNEIIEPLNPKLYTVLDVGLLTDDIEGMLGIVKYVKTHECYLCVPQEWMPILIRRYGIGIEKLVGVELIRDEVLIPTVDCLKMCRLGSVILGMGVPLGLAFHNKLFFAGCDGIDLEKQNSTWENSKEMVTSVQFNEKTLFGLACMDGYVNGNMIASGYKKLFDFLESKEVTIYSLTHSYFPELESNYIEIEQGHE